MLSKKHHVNLLPALCYLCPGLKPDWEISFCTSKNPLISICRNINIQLWALFKPEGELLHTKQCVWLSSFPSFHKEVAAQGADSQCKARGCCCTPDSSHCPQFLFPASGLCPCWVWVSVLLRVMIVWLAAKGLRIQIRTAFPSPETIVPGDGSCADPAAPVFCSYPEVNGNLKASREAASREATSHQFHETANRLPAALLELSKNLQAVFLLSVSAWWSFSQECSGADNRTALLQKPIQM